MKIMLIGVVDKLGMTMSSEVYPAAGIESFMVPV